MQKQLDKDCWHVANLVGTTCHWKKIVKTQKVYKCNKAYQSLKLKNKIGY